MSSDESGGPRYDVVRADPKLRRITVVTLILVILLGGAGLYWLRSLPSGLEQWAREDPEGAIVELKLVLRVIFVAMGVIPISVGVFLMYVSRRVLEQQRYPPAGMRVIVDTVIVRGAPARRMALVGMACSALLIVAGVAGPVIGWRVLEMIGR